MRTYLLYFLFIIFFQKPIISLAWGSKGHKIIVQITNNFLDASTRDSVNKYLDSLPFEEASIWMDDVRSDPNYNYMKPWHYINIEKDKVYATARTPNIISEITRVISELQHRKNISQEQISLDLKVLIHLIGDLYQPLHVGYASDRGGNEIIVQMNGKDINLHAAWDSEIIYEINITTQSSLALYATYTSSQVKAIKQVNIIQWMNESRSLLTNVYDFENNTLTDQYVNSNSTIIQKQLLLAGLRLSEILNQLFV